MPEVITHSDMRAQSDTDLVRLAVAGAQAAFGELITRHAASVRTHLRRMGAQGADADDMAQEAFLIAYQRLDEFRFEGPVAGWLKMIASRRYLKTLKSSKKYLFVDDMTPYQPETDSGAFIPNAVSKGDIDQALEQLRPIERLCVSLNFSGGYNHDDIATETQLPLGTVKSHIRRGLEKLKLILGAANNPVPQNSSSPHMPTQGAVAESGS
jgi:RNA polymerase sigma factor (sigma-70 family)